MTVAWSKGCRRHYPYYLCDTRGCPSKPKSIAGAKIEDGFAEVLRNLQPSRELIELSGAMFKDAWNTRMTEAESTKRALEKQCKDTEAPIDGLLDRIVGASSPTVVAAYEKRVAKLERERISLANRASRTLPPKGRFKEIIKLTLEFLAKP